MPDVTDTGTIIGNIKPQQPLEPTPILVPNENINNVDMMDIDDNNDNETPETINEEDALQTIEKLRSDDLPSRVEAARKLSTIALALGPQRTRDELLPFLSDGVDDDDEVLEAIAISLGKLVPYVGGKQYISSLLQPLELLLAVEENVVRDKAAQSVISISKQMSSDDYNKEFVGMIERLATKEWFTARISACYLIPVAFSQMSTEEMQLKHIQYLHLPC